MYIYMYVCDPYVKKINFISVECNNPFVLLQYTGLVYHSTIECEITSSTPMFVFS